MKPVYVEEPLHLPLLSHVLLKYARQASFRILLLALSEQYDMTLRNRAGGIHPREVHKERRTQSCRFREPFPTPSRSHFLGPLVEVGDERKQVVEHNDAACGKTVEESLKSLKENGVFGYVKGATEHAD